MEIRWNETPRPIWEAAMHRAAWAQNWAYGAAFVQGGLSVHRAEIIEDDETVGYAQFTSRTFLGHVHIATCTRGPVWCRDVGEGGRREAYRALRRTIPLPRLRGVFFTPDATMEESTPLRAARLTQVMSPYSTALIDLTPDDEVLLRAMHGKWRNRLRRTEKSDIDVRIKPVRPGEYDWFLKEETVQQSRRRYRTIPPAFVSTWQGQGAHSGRDGVVLATASRGDAHLGAMLFLLHGAGALYHFGTASDAGRAANVHNMLLWRGMLALRRKGIERLDLGGLDTLDTPGIARFKLGAGAQVRTLCGTWC